MRVAKAEYSARTGSPLRLRDELQSLSRSKVNAEVRSRSALTGHVHVYNPRLDREFQNKYRHLPGLGLDMMPAVIVPKTKCQLPVSVRIVVLLRSSTLTPKWGAAINASATIIPHLCR